MEYQDLEQLREHWLSGEFDYPDQISVAGIPYKHRPEPNQTFERVVVDGKKGYIIYRTSKPHHQEAIEAGLNDLIVFIWGKETEETIKPYDIRTVPLQNIAQNLGESQERIGDVAILKIFLPSGTFALKGKVDTGAEISSLHADKYEIVGDTVKFINKELSENIISVPIAEQQAVKSADGGVEYRPVIELDIEINNKPVRGVLFNLNNREQMDYPCLIGQNVLEKTNFLVDPKIDDPAAEEQFESEDIIDLNILEEQFKDVKPATTPNQTEQIKQISNMLENSNITLQDLIRFIRTDARTILDEIEY